MKYFIALLVLTIFGACTNETDVKQETARRLDREQKTIEEQVKSARLTRFFIADSSDSGTLEADATDEGIRKLRQMSGFYQDGELKSARVIAKSQRYREFVETNGKNPAIRQFRRETAEKLMATNSGMSLSEKAYYTNELVTYRSDEVKLIRESVLSLKGSLSAENYAQMTKKAQQLFDQYEAHFQKELNEYKTKQGKTYQERAIYALNRVWAEQGLVLIQDNRHLLQPVD